MVRAIVLPRSFLGKVVGPRDRKISRLSRANRLVQRIRDREPRELEWSMISTFSNSTLREERAFSGKLDSEKFSHSFNDSSRRFIDLWREIRNRIPIVALTPERSRSLTRGADGFSIGNVDDFSSCSLPDYSSRCWNYSARVQSRKVSP